MRGRQRPIIVCMPDFDENSGGSIVLHRLVDRLRSQGIEAYGFPFRAMGARQRSPFSNLKRLVRRKVTALTREPPSLLTHPSMDVPAAPHGTLRDAVVVYPEIIDGNPLGSKRVVRWLLNKKDFFRETRPIASSDMVVLYQEAFRNPESLQEQHVLRVRWLRNDIYFDRDLPGRSGACRLVRKGARSGAAAPPPDDDAIPLDGRSHEEMAEIFNRTEVMYCHDPYTMYCYYAALCGCVPVVIPQPGLDASGWRATFELKHGVAYGIEEIEWARATRQELISEMAAAEAAEVENVLFFAKKVAERFP